MSRPRHLEFGNRTIRCAAGVLAASGLVLLCPVTVMAGNSMQGMKMYVFPEQNNDAELMVTTTASGGTAKNLKMVVFDGGAASIQADSAGQSHRLGDSANGQMPAREEYPESDAHESEIEVKSYVEAGYRHDELKWNKAAPGGTPNVLSELQWNDVESAVITAGTDISFSDNWHIEGKVSYGQPTDGNNQDSDYFFNDRQGEFSRSNNNSDDGHLVDLSASLGYNFNVGRGKTFPHGWITPKAGFSFHNQKFGISDGYQTIPAFGSFNGLDSSYETNWLGSFLGLTTQFATGERFSLDANVEYHWTYYEGTGHWNLRDDLQQPISFKHTADGEGIVASAIARYRLTPDWVLRLSAEYQNWLANDNGTDRMFFSDGSSAEMPLNEAKWQSYGLNLGVEYVF